MKTINQTSGTAIAALLAAAAILLGYIESLIPIVPPVAGIKLGISNIAVLMAMKLLCSPGYALAVMLTKVIVCALLFGGLGSLPYSMAGGLFSLLVMSVCVRFDRLSAAGVSACGGAAHMAAQIGVAVAITSVVEVAMLLPILMAVGALTGFANGVIVNLTETRLSKYLKSSP